jgi:hypothetical protein
MSKLARDFGLAQGGQNSTAYLWQRIPAIREISGKWFLAEKCRLERGARFLLPRLANDVQPPIVEHFIFV